jgi:hypothetical protein
MTEKIKYFLPAAVLVIVVLSLLLYRVNHQNQLGQELQAKAVPSLQLDPGITGPQIAMKYTAEERAAYLAAKRQYQAERDNFFAKIGISGVVLLAGVYVMLSKKSSPDTVKWAVGIIGIVIGYWLK